MEHRAQIDPHLARLRQRFGGAVSHVLSDPACGRFGVPDIDGVIAYREGAFSCVAMGDPVCDAADASELAEEFRSACERRGLSTLFACASPRFAEECMQHGWAAVEFGQEMIFDPARDPQAGAHGRELRKKVQRARKAGVSVEEFRPQRDDVVLARSLEAAGRRWLLARRGLQAYIAPIDLFHDLSGRRWFYALEGSRVVGVVSLMRLDGREGWLLEHLFTVSDAPIGTSELLVAEIFERLGDEGCHWLSFGPLAFGRLGRFHRLGRAATWILRTAFRLSSRLMRLDSLAHYRRKFQPTEIEPSYLLIHPAHFGWPEAQGLLRAFNCSLRWVRS